MPSPSLHYRPVAVLRLYALWQGASATAVNRLGARLVGIRHAVGTIHSLLPRDRAISGYLIVRSRRCTMKPFPDRPQGFIPPSSGSSATLDRIAAPVVARSRRSRLLCHNFKESSFTLIFRSRARSLARLAVEKRRIDRDDDAALPSSFCAVMAGFRSSPACAF